MTALVWDRPLDRQYEAGIDRGVLYFLDGTAVAWNGLISIADDRSRDVVPSYMDGIKYQEHVIPSDYSARLSAFTYPDELDSLVGNALYAPGVRVYDQPTKMFHLSYRTLLGDDINGLGHGYKIHVVYNLFAVPSDVTIETTTDSTTPSSFEWDLSGTPVYLDGYRATNHISVDSRSLPPIALIGLENALYGTPTTNPSLPAMGDLLDLIS